MSHVLVMFNQVLLRLFAHHSCEMNWSENKEANNSNLYIQLKITHKKLKKNEERKTLNKKKETKHFR